MRKISFVIEGGGLGVQLSQLAAGFSLARRRKQSLNLISNFSSEVRTSFTWRYQLDILNLDGLNLFDVKVTESKIIPRIHPARVSRWANPFPQPFFWLFSFRLYRGSRVGIHYLKGSETEVKDLVFRALSHADLAAQLSKVSHQLKNTLGIHLRLGDYQSSKVHHTLSKEYFETAINRGKGTCSQIVVFSDDVAQAKALVQGWKTDLEVSYFESNSNNPWLDLIAMSRCEALVLSNSIFSWWAGFLGTENRTVVAPKIFFAKNYRYKNIPSWISNLLWRRMLPKNWISVAG